MRFYFGIFDGRIWVRDDFGTELRHVGSARQQAILSLTELAHEQLPQTGDKAQIRIRVRSQAGPHFIVKLDFEIESQGRNKASAVGLLKGLRRPSRESHHAIIRKTGPGLSRGY